MLNAAESAARIVELNRHAGEQARVGPDTTVLRELRTGSNGTKYNLVTMSPVTLHRDSGQPRDIYAAARCISSEVDTKRSGAYLLGVAECLRNSALDEETGVYQICTWRTTAEYTWTKGFYGEQHGRRVSTARDPVERGILAAKMAINEQSNYFNGARRWYDPKVQDGGVQGIRTLDYDAIGIAEKWGAECWQWIGHMPDVNPYEFAVLRKVSKPVTNSDLVAVIKSARAGNNVTPTVPTPDNPTPNTPSPEQAAVAESGFPWWMLIAGVVAYKYVG